jgi:hypothetical protein
LSRYHRSWAGEVPTFRRAVVAAGFRGWARASAAPRDGLRSDSPRFSRPSVVDGISHSRPSFRAPGSRPARQASLTHSALRVGRRLAPYSAAVNSSGAASASLVSLVRAGVGARVSRTSCSRSHRIGTMASSGRLAKISRRLSGVLAVLAPRETISSGRAGVTVSVSGCAFDAATPGRRGLPDGTGTAKAADRVCDMSAGRGGLQWATTVGRRSPERVGRQSVLDARPSHALSSVALPPLFAGTAVSLAVLRGRDGPERESTVRETTRMCWVHRAQPALARNRACHSAA